MSTGKHLNSLLSEESEHLGLRNVCYWTGTSNSSLTRSISDNVLSPDLIWSCSPFFSDHPFASPPPWVTLDKSFNLRCSLSERGSVMDFPLSKHLQGSKVSLKWKIRKMYKFSVAFRLIVLYFYTVLVLRAYRQTFHLDKKSAFASIRYYPISLPAVTAIQQLSLCLHGPWMHKGG